MHFRERQNAAPSTSQKEKKLCFLPAVTSEFRNVKRGFLIALIFLYKFIGENKIATRFCHVTDGIQDRGTDQRNIAPNFGWQQRMMTPFIY
jgi:hypothetical protein